MLSTDPNCNLSKVDVDSVSFSTCFNVSKNQGNMGQAHLYGRERYGKVWKGMERYGKVWKGILTRCRLHCVGSSDQDNADKQDYTILYNIIHNFHHLSLTFSFRTKSVLMCSREDHITLPEDSVKIECTHTGKDQPRHSQSQSAKVPTESHERCSAHASLWSCNLTAGELFSFQYLFGWFDKAQLEALSTLGRWEMKTSCFWEFSVKRCQWLHKCCGKKGRHTPQHLTCSCHILPHMLWKFMEHVK